MKAESQRARRRFLAPEVVQTSAMDCGPATLKCLLEGFGIRVSYGRLREACQTDLDGTSIDTLEEIAQQLGLEAEQIMLPLDHLFLAEVEALPALVVVRLPNGLTHFLVVWRQHGPLVQLMDPGTGRRWTTCRRFLEEVYVHTMTIPASDWREWAGSEQSLRALERRLANLKVSGRLAQPMIQAALADPSWRGLGTLDAAVRMVGAIVRAGGLRPGPETAGVLQAFLDQARRPETGGQQPIPSAYWSVQPAPPSQDGVEQVSLRGMVLVRVSGRRTESVAAPAAPPPATPAVEASEGRIPQTTDKASRLSPELVAALAEPPSRPGRDLWGLLRADGLFTPAVLLVALALAAAGLLLEALLFRGLLEIGRELNLVTQRLTAMGGICLFTLALLLLELPIASGLLRLGRRLESRLRLAFLDKIPRLVDRYFQSRLVSDMAERSHMVHWIRLLPYLGGSLLRYCFELVLTTAGIIWLAPNSAPLALAAALACAGLPLLLNPVLTERELRIRTHMGALSRFYLDALLGLTAVRAHGAERALRTEHESLLVEWARAGLGLQRAIAVVEGVHAFAGFGLAAWLLLAHLQRGGDAAAVLLLIYWALNLPVLGQEIALLARQYPVQRNVTLRLLEPLGAPEIAEGPEMVPGKGLAGYATAHEPGTETLNVQRSTLNAQRSTLNVQRSTANRQPPTANRQLVPREAATSERGGGAPAVVSAQGQSLSGSDAKGVHLAFEEVSVRVAGHTILQDINLRIEPGHHLAIVGRSGAGKSSLVGLLLGWHRPATGRVLVDGHPVEGPTLARLRQQTAWVDPAVQLWNRSFLENLRYGTPADADLPCGWALEQADLLKVLEKLPDGLQTPLGEGGGLLSGGEAQRIRFGRGTLRPGVRLAILDEPFRGLDREKRRELLAKARKLWAGVTLLCVTHDVGETQGFDRVLVVEGGRIVEEGVPAELCQQSGSRYTALLEAETAVRQNLWSSQVWQRLYLEAGKLEANP